MMLTNISPAYPSILELQPYQTGKPIDELSRELGISDIIKLASNENPLGCSPKVTLAITSQLGELARYPDGSGYHLKQQIAELTGKNLENITLGNGSNDLLEIIARTFVGCQDAIVFSQYAFAVYPLVTKAIGATAVEVPAKQFGHDLEAMQQAVHDNSNVKLVFIANPNNPTGTQVTSEQIQEFLQDIPNHVVVVLDEAYVEFGSQNNNVHLLDEFDNLIIVRTLSKAYGLAGLRLGYALSSEAIAKFLNRIRQPFNVNVLAQVAGIEALKDQSFISHVKQLNDEQRQSLYNGLDSLGLEFVKSYTNFIMVNVGDGDDVYQQLLEQGVIVRPLSGYGLSEWVRVTIGLPEENARFLDTIAQVLA